MKLIDTDQMNRKIEEVYHDYERDNLHFTYRIFNQIYNAVNEIPATDAIPIEYIEEWMVSELGYGVRNGKVFTVMILEKLIEDWREKNGDNN